MEKQAELDLIRKKNEEEAKARRRYSPQNNEVLHDIMSETEDEDGKDRPHPVSVAINLSKLQSVQKRRDTHSPARNSPRPSVKKTAAASKDPKRKPSSMGMMAKSKQ